MFLLFLPSARGLISTPHSQHSPPRCAARVVLRACSPADVAVAAAARAAGDAASAPAFPRLPQREPMDSWYEAFLFFVCRVYSSALTTLALLPLAVSLYLLVGANLMGDDDDDGEMR